MMRCQGKGVVGYWIIGMGGAKDMMGDWSIWMGGSKVVMGVRSIRKDRGEVV